MITVAHLDHTVEQGGAELALARLVEQQGEWSPRLFIPPGKQGGKGVFVAVPPGVVFQVGMEQPAGAIASGSFGQLTLLARALYQGIAIRANRSFRSSDVVHANTSRAAIFGWLACVGSSRPLVVHLRDAVDVDALGVRNTRLLTFVLSRAAGVIANSEYTLRTALPYLSPRTLARVIPSPIGLANHRPVSPVNKSAQAIGMLARITEWKGQELLIRAFADEFRHSSLTLEFAGSAAFGQDGYLLRLKGLVDELGINRQVRFLGHVNDIWSVIDSWDICVHASLHSEPLGQNVLQYLAACRPTVAANAGGPTEWIQHERTGLLFEPGNQQALSYSLRRLAHDSGLRSTLSANLARDRSVPTDQSVREMYADFFESVCIRSATAV